MAERLIKRRLNDDYGIYYN